MPINGDSTAKPRTPQRIPELFLIPAVPYPRYKRKRPAEIEESPPAFLAYDVYDVAQSTTLPDAASLRETTVYSAKIIRWIESPVSASWTDWNGRRYAIAQ